MDAVPLRIAHILAPADFGGLEQVVRNLVLGQHERGNDVRVVAILDQDRRQASPLVEELADFGIGTDALAIAARAYGTERRLTEEALRRFTPQVVHTHGARVDVLDAPVARRAGFPIVTTVHGFTGGGVKNRLYEALQRRAMRRADAVIAVSRAQVSVLRASGVVAERLHVVPNAWSGNGVGLSRVEARAYLGLNPDAGIVVGWVGRLTREKGPDQFLEAVARLAIPDVHCIIVGDGREREALVHLAARLGIQDRVRWAGAVPGAARMLKALDVFVMSSRTEGTPIVLFEAMAAGVPVVTSSVGGIPDVVGSEEAILVTPGNPDLLAQGIRQVLDDPAASRVRTAAARTRLDHFRTPPWIDRYELIYRSVCGIPGERASG